MCRDTYLVEQLIECATEVVNLWSTSKLAEAVNNLRYVLECLGEYLEESID
jgi:hypothetical protein